MKRILLVVGFGGYGAAWSASAVNSNIESLANSTIADGSAGNAAESTAESSLAEGSVADGEDKGNKQNGYPSDASLGTGDGSATGEQTESGTGEAGGEDVKTEPENTESGVQSNASGANVAVDEEELKNAPDASALEQMNGTGGYGQYISDEETNSRGSFYDVDTSGLSTNVEIY